MDGASGGSSEAVARVRTELERVREQERAVYAGAAKSLDELIGALQHTVAAIKADDASLKTIQSSVVGAAKSVSEHKNILAKEFKQLFTSVTAFGTELDRAVPQNLEKAVKPDIFAPATVNQVIADALLRDGRFALAQQLADEARARSAGGSAALAVAGSGAGGAAFHAATAAWTGASVDALRVAFEELHSVVAALRARNVQPAIAWAAQQRAVLQSRRPPAISVGDFKYSATSVASSSASATLGAAAMTDDAPSGAASSASAASAGAAAISAESSYGAVGSSAAERLDALHDLLFALHRLRFLQLLTVDSPCTVHHTPAPAAASGSGAPQLTLALARSLSAAPASASSSSAGVTNGSGPTPMAISKSDDPLARAAASPGRPAAAAAAAAAAAGPPAQSLYATARASTAAAAAGGSTAPATSSSASLPAKSALSARISHYTLAALNYAQQHFAAFAKTHMSEIQRLSGCVLFGFDLTRAAQTYPELTTCALWDDAESAFRTAAYRSLGVSARSPLHAALTASDVSLPKLIRHAVVTEQAAALLVGGRAGGGGAGGGGGAAADVLSSAEVDLGREHQYHTTFICPVTKDQTTHDNPPVLLRCGHVISTNAMHKMIRSNRINRSGRFKCPTCPREQLPTEVLTVHF